MRCFFSSANSGILKGSNLKREIDMCEKQERIDALELEVAELHRTYSETIKNITESKYNESKIKWHPLQVALIPIVISLIALIAAIAK